MPASSHGKRYNIFFAVGKGILGASQRAFEQTNVAEEMPLSGFLDLKPVFLNHRVAIGSQRGSFGKGGSQFGEAGHELAAQRLMIDLALGRLGTQHFGLVTRLRGSVVAIDRLHGPNVILAPSLCKRLPLTRPSLRDGHPLPASGARG
jgi:hypothetical protein